MTIGEDAFSGRTSLSTVTILMGDKTIGDEAFSGGVPQSAQNFEDRTTIGVRAFLSCGSLITIKFPTTARGSKK